MPITFRIVGIYCNLTVSDAEYDSIAASRPDPKVRDIMDYLSQREEAFSYEGDDDLSNSMFRREDATLYSASFTVTTPGTVSGSNRPIPIGTYELIDTPNDVSNVYQEFQYYIRRRVGDDAFRDLSGGGKFIPFGSPDSETIETNDTIIWRMVSIRLPKGPDHPLKLRNRMRATALRLV